MFKVAIFACVLAFASAGFLNYAYSGPHIYAYAAPAPIISSSQYKAQDTLGQYNYGYATGNGIAQSETRGISGEVAGGYSYTSPEGKQVKISYTAGEGGFKASGDAIPKAPEPTAEVDAATKEHLAAKVEAAAKAAADPEPEPIAYADPIAYAGHFPYAYTKTIHPAIAYAAPHHVKVVYAQPNISPPSAYSYSFSTA
uniref:Uncharacterized protein n=1 Tax=Strigamia maritima TaxID=126957 RepID=T1IS69_STRMM